MSTEKISVTVVEEEGIQQHGKKDRKVVQEVTWTQARAPKEKQANVHVLIHKQGEGTTGVRMVKEGGERLIYTSMGLKVPLGKGRNRE